MTIHKDHELVWGQKQHNTVLYHDIQKSYNKYVGFTQCIIIITMHTKLIA